MDLAIQRTESYGSSKRILIISTPTEKGLSRVDRLYQETDRRRFYVPCPRCAEAITLEFGQLTRNCGEVVYRCPLCEREIQERDKLIAYYVLNGDVTEPDVWQRLDELLTRSYPHTSGMPLTIQAVCIDAGFSPAEVTAFTRHRHGQRVYATKGLSSAWGRAIWPLKASWDKNKHAIYAISSDEAKVFTANRLRIDAPGPGYLHFPISRPRDWYEQLVVEKLIIQKDGQRKWVNPTRARNESTDCRALAVAALHARLLAGCDLTRWVADFQRMLEPPKPQAARVNGPPPAQPAVVRSRFVWG